MKTFMLSQTAKLNQTNLIIHAFPNKKQMKQMKRKTKLKSENTNTNTYPVSNTKTNTYPTWRQIWNTCPTREAYCCFAVTGERRQELRQGVIASGNSESSGDDESCVARGKSERERERDLNNSNYWEKRLNLYLVNLKT